MNKFEKLEGLRLQGLNVPEYFLLEKGLTDYVKADEFISRKKGASIRTFTEDASNLECPHYPNQTLERAMELVRTLSSSYYVILAEPIDPRAALAAGTIETDGGVEADSRSLEFTLVLNKGDGAKVRDVIQAGKKDLIFKVAGTEDLSQRPSIPADLLEAIEQAVDSVLSTPHNDHIFEVSLYPSELGTQGTKVIFWEAYKRSNIAKV